MIFDNSADAPRVIAYEEHGIMSVEDKDLYDIIMEGVTK